MFAQKPIDYGDVFFSMSYLPTAERLTLVIVKARNLKWPLVKGGAGGKGLEKPAPTQKSHQIHMWILCVVPNSHVLFTYERNAKG